MVEAFEKFDPSLSDIDFRLSEDIRADFFKKVFGIITLQLAITVGICAICMTVSQVKEFMLENIWVLIVAALTALFLMILPLCFDSLRYRVPHNYINLLLFVRTKQTVCEGITVAYPCIVFPPDLVITAGILTMAAAVGCVTGAMVLNDDNYFFVLVLSSLIFDLVTSIILVIVAPFALDLASLVLAMQSLCALCVFGGAIYIIIDVFLLFKCKWYGITHEDYIFAAMIIYLDIIQLFLRILKFLAQLKEAIDGKKH